MDEVTNDGMNDEQRAYLEGLRQSVATIQSMNASHLEVARKLEGMTASFLAGPAEKMLVENERSRRYYQQIGAVQAAQATAYETMLAAGGPENSRAYVEYEAACRRNIALLPQDDLTQHSLDPKDFDHLF